MADEPAPAPAASNPMPAGEPKQWEPPDSDEEFVFEKIELGTRMGRQELGLVRSRPRTRRSRRQS